MARETFKVEGLRELEQALIELPKATGRNVLLRALKKAGEPIRNVAEAIAPRESGRLATSVSVSTKLSRRQRKLHRKESPVEVFVGPGPHAKAVQQEFGNAHHGPQPFMRPAFDGNARKSIEIFAKDAWAELDKARARLARKTARLAAKA